MFKTMGARGVKRVEFSFKFLISALSAVLCAGCLSVKNVDYSSSANCPEAFNPVRAYFDLDGDVYPPEGGRAGMSLLGERNPSLICGAHGNDVTMCPPGSDEVIRANGKFAAYQTWQAQQDDIIRKLSSEVSERLEKSKTKTLIVLIHGFRVPDARNNYTCLHHMLLNDRPIEDAPVFLEVYWDGRDTEELPFTALKAWKPAQYTAPLVGFRLRSLLNQVVDGSGNPTGKKLVVLTHSTGAAAAGALFGDPTEALPCLHGNSAKCGAGYERFKRFLGAADGINKSPDWENTILAMLAAATPASTFAVDEKEALGFHGPTNTQIYLTLNRKDYALRKFVGWPSLLGYSGLGAYESEARILQTELGGRDRAQVSILDVTADLGAEHSVLAYAGARAFEPVIDAIWNNGAD